jgi:hypothetical protein
VTVTKEIVYCFIDLTYQNSSGFIIVTDCFLFYITAAAGNVAITGDIFVAGRKINPVTFRENIAYVMQDDSLLATATPREALTFSANLRFFRLCNP